MGQYDSFDTTEIEGQMTIEDVLDPPERMVAVSQIFARARKQMSLAEQKAFVLALSQIEWTKAPNEQSNVVFIDKKKLQAALGYKSDYTDISENMWREIKDLAPHSHIEIADRDKDIYESGMVITRISRRNSWDYYRVKFEEDYFPLFTGLGKNYITLWSIDIFRMNSKRAVQFYELLRTMSYSKYEVSPNTYTYGFGVKFLKDLFEIPMTGKGSYMREKSGFNRSEFEKKVLDPICADLIQTKMIQLVMQPDGKPYEKVHRGKRVAGYQITWTISHRPKVADAHEVKEIQERVDKNPQVLKVAKDILNGEKKPKKSTTPNGFDNFEKSHDNFDWDSLIEP